MVLSLFYLVRKILILVLISVSLLFGGLLIPVLQEDWHASLSPLPQLKKSSHNSRASLFSLGLFSSSL